VIVTFDDFFAAMQFGYDVALADGVVKKLITPMSGRFDPLPGAEEITARGKHVIFLHDRRAVAESFKAMLGTRALLHTSNRTTNSAGKEPLYELHLEPPTLQWLKQDRTITICSACSAMTG